MTRTIIIQKDDETTSKNEKDYMKYTIEGVPTVTVKVNEDRSKGKTHVHIRPRGMTAILNDRKVSHQEYHDDEDKTCYKNCFTCIKIEEERLAAEAKAKAEAEAKAMKGR